MESKAKSFEEDNLNIKIQLAIDFKDLIYLKSSLNLKCNNVEEFFTEIRTQAENLVKEELIKRDEKLKRQITANLDNENKNSRINKSSEIVEIEVDERDKQSSQPSNKTNFKNKPIEKQKVISKPNENLLVNSKCSNLSNNKETNRNNNNANNTNYKQKPNNNNAKKSRQQPYLNKNNNRNNLQRRSQSNDASQKINGYDRNYNYPTTTGMHSTNSFGNKQHGNFNNNHLPNRFNSIPFEENIFKNNYNISSNPSTSSSNSFPFQKIHSQKKS